MREGLRMGSIWLGSFVMIGFLFLGSWTVGTIVIDAGILICDQWRVFKVEEGSDCRLCWNCENDPADLEMVFRSFRNWLFVKNVFWSPLDMNL